MKKYVCVRQEGIKDCGICSLLTIIKFYGGDVPREYLRNLTNTTNDGVTAFSLIEGAKKIGFDAKGVKGDILDIDKPFLPCIAHVINDNKYKHFVVIHEINRRKNTVILADPARGIVKMTIEQFRNISTSIFLFLKPSKVLPVIKDENKIKEIIYHFLCHNRKSIIIIFIFSIIFTLINILTSFNFQFIIDKSITYNSSDNLYYLSFIFIYLIVIKCLVSYYRNNIINFLNHKLDYSLITNVFRHVVLLPHLYYKSRTTGEIISRINDLGELRESFSNLIVTFLVDIVIIIFVIFFMFRISYRLSIMVILMLVIYSSLNLIFNRILNKKIKIIKEEASSFNSFMIETINASDSIKGMNIYDTILNKSFNLYDRYLNSSYEYLFISNIQNSLGELIVYTFISLVIMLGSRYVLDGDLSLGSIITFNSLIYYLLDPIKNILKFDILFKKTKIVIERMNELLNIEEEKISTDDNLLSNVNGDIKINDLIYSYNGRDNLINRFSLYIKKGEKVVICGSSGSGKSTLAKIISRYIKIKRGCIKIGDLDINDYNLKSFRDGITYVSQNEFLFYDTIYNNINIDNARDDVNFIKVCNLFLVDEVANSRNGYNTLLEENAVNISGGERQRVILARAFTKDSNIYILDEAFSQIDPKMERIILKNLFETYKGKTIIVVSHRFDNNDLYDRVVNMENFNYGY